MVMGGLGWHSEHVFYYMENMNILMSNMSNGRGCNLCLKVILWGETVVSGSGMVTSFGRLAD